MTDTVHRATVSTAFAERPQHSPTWTNATSCPHCVAEILYIRHIVLSSVGTSVWETCHFDFTIHMPWKLSNFHRKKGINICAGCSLVVASSLVLMLQMAIARCSVQMEWTKPTDWPIVIRLGFLPVHLAQRPFAEQRWWDGIQYFTKR